jgi:hypothetical protein
MIDLTKTADIFQSGMFSGNTYNTKIEVPKNVNIIHKTTNFIPGIFISDNLTLDSLTCGDENTIVSVHMKDALYNRNGDYLANPVGTYHPMPEIWKVAQNLQYLAVGIVEPLIAELGEELILYTAYQDPTINTEAKDNPYSKHYTGEAIKIGVNVIDYNLYAVAHELLDMFYGRITKLGFIANRRCWIHLEINGPNNIFGGDRINPEVYTLDIEDGSYYTGLIPIRGL